MFLRVRLADARSYASRKVRRESGPPRAGSEFALFLFLLRLLAAVPAVGLAGGGIEFREDGGEARTGRFARVGVSTGGDGFLDEGRVAHVEEFVVLVHLPTLLAHEPARAELHVGPFARCAFLAAQLRRDTAAVVFEIPGQLPAGQFDERREHVAEVDDVLAHFSRGRRAGPACDERHARAAFEHGGFLPTDHAAANGARVVERRAVVAGEHHQRLFAQAELVEFGDDFAHLLVHVADVVLVQVRLGDLPGVGRFENGSVDEVHRIVEEERPVLVPADEVEAEGLDDIRIVVVGRNRLAALGIGLLPIPAARRRVGAVFVEAPVARSLADLPPFAGFAGHVTGLLHQFRHRLFVLRLRAGAVPTPRAVADSAGAKRVAPRHQHTARRPAQRRGVTRLEARARRRELVDLRRFVRVRAVATDAVEPEVLGEDENDVGFRG